MSHTHPTLEEVFNLFVEDARKRVIAMDAIDKTNGFLTPNQVPVLEQCEIAKAALRAGLTALINEREESALDCFFEAYVYLEKVTR